jgi:hypothetical protein
MYMGMTVEGWSEASAFFLDFEKKMVIDKYGNMSNNNTKFKIIITRGPKYLFNVEIKILGHS